LGEKEASNSILKSIEKTLSVQKNRTKDLNGSSNTKECAKAVLGNLS
jgi:tartrate dehydrogenase/decarboxylase/D-malate dehydrogenase